MSGLYNLVPQYISEGIKNSKFFLKIILISNFFNNVKIMETFSVFCEG